MWCVKGILCEFVLLPNNPQHAYETTIKLFSDVFTLLGLEAGSCRWLGGYEIVFPLGEEGRLNRENNGRHGENDPAGFSLLIFSLDIRLSFPPSSLHLQSIILGVRILVFHTTWLMFMYFLVRFIFHLLFRSSRQGSTYPPSPPLCVCGCLLYLLFCCYW